MGRFISNLAILIGLIGFSVWLFLTLGFSGGPSDFTQDYAAGHALLHGVSIYGGTIEEYTRNLLGFSGHFNFHPPTNAVFFLPLALLPYPLAFIVWNTANIILYGIIFILCQRMFHTTVPVWQMFSFGLVWWPFVHTTQLGQSSIVIAALLVFGWRVARGGQRPALAGALFGLAATIKLFPAFLGVYFLLSRNWRALASMVGVFLGAAAASVLIVGREDALVYLSTIMPQDVREWGHFPLNCSLTGLILPLLAASEFIQPLTALPLSEVISAVSLLSLIVGVAGAAAAYRFLKSGQRDEAFFLLVIVMLLISPITWMHMFLILIPLFVFLSLHLQKPLERGALVGVLFLLSVPDVLATRSVYSVYSPGLIPPEIYLALRAPTFGLMLLIPLIALARRRAPISGA